MAADPVDDPTFDLAKTLKVELASILMFDRYIADAEREGDEEVAAFFRELQDGDRKRSAQLRDLLRARLGSS